MAEIRNKRTFFELWEAGVVGNRTRIFHSLAEVYDSGVKERIGFRELRVGGGAWERASTIADVPEIHARWRASGRTFIMDDAVPDDRTTIQGEICISNTDPYFGLYGFIATSPRRGLPPMRQTIAAGLHRSYKRVEVRALMNRYMDPASRDDIDTLLELYPDATIEFACFDVNVGNIPGRNTIIWEVRNY